MKRYQCIKQDRDYFTLGKIYEVKPYRNGTVYISDDNGEINIAGPTFLSEYFQELLDLHVDDIPRDEADSEPLTTPEPRRKLTAGWAWFIALMITIGFFVLKAFTE